MRIVILMLIAWLHCPAIEAGTVSIESWRGRDVLKLSGQIEVGLSDELLAQIGQVEEFPHGAKVLLLSSPGGSVREALKISEILDQYDVHTVVPNFGECASACASIVFIAGKYRTVEAFGLLGQHSCAANGVPNEACNELLAEHAVQHGVSYGAVAAFVNYTAPADMQWLSREEADGWGLSRYPGSDLSGFERSEDYVFRMLSGRIPSAQSAWRLDFYKDGYRAFLRPAADSMREMQLNVFCEETAPGILMLSMDIPTRAEDMASSIEKVLIRLDGAEWEDWSPRIRNVEENWLSVVVSIPKERLRPILTESDALEFEVRFSSSYEPLIASTYLSSSRKVLLFAANNCASIYSQLHPF